MNIVYALEPIPAGPSVFLAGPTPRSEAVFSWRPRALQLLRGRGFDGSVFVPEPKGPWDWGRQVQWEAEALHAATVILFWIPRDLVTMPAFTTNVEFGFWCRSGKVVLGAPGDAPKMRYLRHYAGRFEVPQADTLEDTVTVAIELLGPA